MGQCAQCQCVDETSIDGAVAELDKELVYEIEGSKITLTVQRLGDVLQTLDQVRKVHSSTKHRSLTGRVLPGRNSRVALRAGGAIAEPGNG